MKKLLLALIFPVLAYANTPSGPNSPIIYGLNGTTPCAYNLIAGACIPSSGSFAGFPDGTVSAPGGYFASETGTGLYRIGAGDIGFATTGTLAMEVLKISPTQFNFGMGAAAINTTGNALQAGYTYNGTAQWNYSNYSTGTNSVTQFYIGNGPGGSNGIIVQNGAYQTAGEFSGGGALRATSSLTQLTISSEATAGFINFLVGGALAANEVMRLDQYGHELHKGTTPTITANCGTSPSVTGNDVVGVINVGTGGTATTCTMTFANAWGSTPHCFLEDESATIAVKATPSTATLIITAATAFTASSLIDYHCIGHE